MRIRRCCAGAPSPVGIVFEISHTNKRVMMVFGLVFSTGRAILGAKAIFMEHLQGRAILGAKAICWLRNQNSFIQWDHPII